MCVWANLFMKMIECGTRNNPSISIVTRVLLHSQKNWSRYSTWLSTLVVIIFMCHWLLNKIKDWITELEFFDTVSRLFSNINPAISNIVSKLFLMVNTWHLKTYVNHYTFKLLYSFVKKQTWYNVRGQCKQINISTFLK